ncbi:MAG: hypothetical protein HYZ42_11595, partial [Bacteroidetes bacterium]|nr:hypothetical protein [Bacteroidota bacterium]
NVGQSSKIEESREVTYTGTNLKVVTTTNGSGLSSEYAYSLALEIKSDGICHSKEDLKYPSSTGTGTTEGDGRWNWVNDSKNKDNVYIQDLIGSFLANQLDPKFQFTSWYISGLKNKELEFTLTAHNKVSNSEKKNQADVEEDYNFIVTFKQ